MDTEQQHQKHTQQRDGAGAGHDCREREGFQGNAITADWASALKAETAAEAAYKNVSVGLYTFIIPGSCLGACELEVFFCPFSA